MKIILLGPPGSGKGTIAQILSQKTGSIHFSTGQFFRKALKEKINLSVDINKYINSGDLIPDNIVRNIVENELIQEKFKKGFILDGFPRTLDQAKDFDYFLNKKGIHLDFVANLSISFNIIIKRIASRRTCSNPSCQEIYNLLLKELNPNPDNTCKRCGNKVVQRDDETEDAIKLRLKIYNQKTAPLIDFYKQKGILINFDSEDTKGTAEEILSPDSKK